MQNRNNDQNRQPGQQDEQISRDPSQQGDEGFQKGRQDQPGSRDQRQQSQTNPNQRQSEPNPRQQGGWGEDPDGQQQS